MLVATLHTVPIEDRAKSEIGQFEMGIEMDPIQCQLSLDPRGFFDFTIQQHLQKAIADTAIPQEYWRVEFEVWAQKTFNLPAKLSFAE